LHHLAAVAGVAEELPELRRRRAGVGDRGRGLARWELGGGEGLYLGGGV